MTNPLNIICDDVGIW